MPQLALFSTVQPSIREPWLTLETFAAIARCLTILDNALQRIERINAPSTRLVLIALQVFQNELLAAMSQTPALPQAATMPFFSVTLVRVP